MTTLQPIENLMYFIVGAYNVCISNWVLSIPIAMSLIYYVYRLFTQLRKVLKGD